MTHDTRCSALSHAHLSPTPAPAPPLLRYIVCGSVNAKPGCATDAKGNIGAGNTGINNIGNNNSGNVSGAGVCCPWGRRRP